MNVPIRMLGIATSIFWIILAAFIASAAYSLKDLNLGVGEPQYFTTPNHEVALTLPFFIDNRGYYDLKGFNLTTVFSDEGGAEISTATTFLPAILQGQNTTILHNATLNIDTLAEQDSRYLFDDGNLTCTITAGLSFAEMLPVRMSSDVPFPWGAPFYNFKLGQPVFAGGNSSHVTAKVTLSYENHAAFDFAGNMRVRLFDAEGTLLGETEKAVNSTKYACYSGNLYFSVPKISAPSETNVSGHFEVYFATSMFDSGPVVIPYG